MIVISDTLPINNLGARNNHQLFLSELAQSNSPQNGGVRGRIP
jgi:hypothetical protein